MPLLYNKLINASNLSAAIAQVQKFALLLPAIVNPKLSPSNLKFLIV